MPIIELAQPVGTGTVELLTCATIQLPSFAPLPATSLSIVKTPVITSCTVIPNKVIFDGTLTKTITFAPGVPNPAFAPISLAGGCGGIITQTSTGLGQTTVVIAFNGFISVPGAMPGDTCTAGVVVDGEADEALQVSGNTFSALLEKTMLLVTASVTREGTFSVPG